MYTKQSQIVLKHGYQALRKDIKIYRSLRQKEKDSDV